MKKGQTEIIGLVVIVMLIVIGALFYVKFVVLGGKNDQMNKENTISSTQAYNLMNAIMNVNVCGNVSVREGFAKCKNSEDLCGKKACDYLDSEIDKIVKSVIYKDYSLNINSSGWNYNLGSCKTYGVSSYSYIYNLRGTTYRAIFKIC